MDKKILFNATPTEKRVALLENNRVVELVVERPDDQRLVGNIYRGRIESVLPGLQAAFIDIGLEKCGFLHVSDVDARLLMEHEELTRVNRRSRSAGSNRGNVPVRLPIERVLEKGQMVVVQVLKEPIGAKGPKLTTQLSLAGRFLVLVPDSDFIGVSKKTSDDKHRRRLKQIISQLKPQGVGFIVRTIGLDVSEKEFISEMQSLIETWRAVQDRALHGAGPATLYRELGITTRVVRDMLSDDVSEVLVDNQQDLEAIQNYLQKMSPHLVSRVKLYADKTPLFDNYNIERDLELSLKRKVWLKGGGYITLDHAEALLAIDVNTGRSVGRGTHEETLLRTNIEAANEISRQLRLRDIGGIIVVDFIDLDKAENRRKLENHMRALLAKDKAANSMTSLSKFGLMEITRKRVRPELQELYTDVCPTCTGLGWVFSPATVVTRIDRWMQRAESQGITGALTITAHPAVINYLTKENRPLLEKMQHQYRIQLQLVEDESLDQDEFEAFAPGAKEPLELKN